jgi:methylenetetrahydrofolate--tRNA-(uracil-5-)-methyltransferase
MLGALCDYVAHAAPDTFQPMKANFGLLPPLVGQRLGKPARYAAYADRALNDLRKFCCTHDINFV